MLKLKVSTTSTLFAALACASVAACGDDITKGNPADARRADAAPIDGSPDGMPDAGPMSTVAGTFAVTDVSLLGADATAVGGIRGGSISFVLNDLTMNGGTVLAGTSVQNGCVVTKFDPTHPPNPLLDGGPITVTNKPPGETPPTGLLKTVGPCTFQSAFGGYVCISNNLTNAGMTAVGGVNGGTGANTIDFVFATGTLTGESLVGSYLVVNGFANTNYNSGTSAFPVVGQAGDTLVIAAATGDADAPEVKASGIAATVLNGFNPVPAAGATANFLGTGSITIDKTAGTAFKMFSQDIDVPGEGFSLSDPGDPLAIPLVGTATDQVYGCGADTSKCGDDSTNIVKAMIISGRATKQAVPAHPDYYMPREVPGTDTWLEFTCGFIGVKSATLDAAALQAIIDFQPTRVELRVINAAGNIVADTTNPNAPNTTFVIAGHAIVGHTTHP
jgi:hypothetical protein